jgi:hypothetical protein
MMRTLRVAEGRVVVLPRDALPGPGATHAVHVEGKILALPDERVTRFVRRRIESGDLIEEHKPSATAAATSAA